MTTQRRFRGGPVVKDYSTKPAPAAGNGHADDNLPELRHLLGPGRCKRTIEAAFVIRLKRQPVAAETRALLNFSPDATADRLLEEIDAMGEFPIATVADAEIRLPGE